MELPIFFYYLLFCHEWHELARMNTNTFMVELIRVHSCNSWLKCKWWKKLNNDILYKSATPMKLNSSAMLGPKLYFLFFAGKTLRREEIQFPRISAKLNVFPSSRQIPLSYPQKNVAPKNRGDLTIACHMKNSYNEPAMFNKQSDRS